MSDEQRRVLIIPHRGNVVVAVPNEDGEPITLELTPDGADSFAEKLKEGAELARAHDPEVLQ